MPHPAMRRRAPFPEARDNIEQQDARESNVRHLATRERTMIEGMVEAGVPRYQAVMVSEALLFARNSPEFASTVGTVGIGQLNAFMNTAGAVAA